MSKLTRAELNTLDAKLQRGYLRITLPVVKVRALIAHVRAQDSFMEEVARHYSGQNSCELISRTAENLRLK